LLIGATKELKICLLYVKFTKNLYTDVFNGSYPFGDGGGLKSHDSIPQVAPMLNVAGALKEFS
jgi:hypothetical protein